ncbi:uncharacterized protein LOC134776494 [Penaeus indicus]|uniref:uncharacterized protein LOC134776494 n=1 Tax=Penaeus indicus TaxID=29960 RepID=UPI00300D3607
MSMLKAKEDWFTDMCNVIEQNLQANNAKKAYQEVKDLTSSKQGRPRTILDKNGKCLTYSKDILNREVEEAVKSLKKGKSAGICNIPGELVQAGGEAMIDVLHAICQKIWETGEWPTPWTQSLVITLPKKGNLQQCNNYRTISLDMPS